jgi:hypothetical protein
MKGDPTLQLIQVVEAVEKKHRKVRQFKTNGGMLYTDSDSSLKFRESQ